MSLKNYSSYTFDRGEDSPCVEWWNGFIELVASSLRYQAKEIAAIILRIYQSRFCLTLNFSWLKKRLVKHHIVDLRTYHSHLKIVLAYNWKLRMELVRLEEWDYVSVAGGKEWQFCPNEFGQRTPQHRAELVFLFRLLMGWHPLARV